MYLSSALLLWWRAKDGSRIGPFPMWQFVEYVAMHEAITEHHELYTVVIGPYHLPVWLRRTKTLILCRAHQPHEGV